MTTSDKGISKIVFIYALKSPIDNSVKYIGKTINPTYRLWRHIYSSQKPKTKKECWIKSLLNLGLLPLFEIIEQCNGDNEADVRECFWIKYYRDSGVNLKNLTSGGDGGYSLTDEAKQKISESLKGNTISQETRDKLSVSVRLAWSDPELIERQREKYKGKKQEQWAVDKRLAAIRAKGKRVVSEETRRKMSEAQTGIPRGKKHVSVIQISLHNEIIKVWESHHDAAESVSADPKNILKCCRGKIHTSKNFKWKFYDDITIGA
jgi:group I intron endonuclease